MSPSKTKFKLPLKVSRPTWGSSAPIAESARTAQVASASPVLFIPERDSAPLPRAGAQTGSRLSADCQSSWRAWSPRRSGLWQNRACPQRAAFAAESPAPDRRLLSANEECCVCAGLALSSVRFPLILPRGIGLLWPVGRLRLRHTPAQCCARERFVVLSTQSDGQIPGIRLQEAMVGRIVFT